MCLDPGQRKGHKTTRGRESPRSAAPCRTVQPSHRQAVVAVAPICSHEIGHQPVSTPPTGPLLDPTEERMSARTSAHLLATLERKRDIKPIQVSSRGPAWDSVEMGCPSLKLLVEGRRRR
jgi:hypothetical protein